MNEKTIKSSKFKNDTNQPIIRSASGYINDHLKLIEINHENSLSNYHINQQKNQLKNDENDYIMLQQESFYDNVSPNYYNEIKNGKIKILI